MTFADRELDYLTGRRLSEGHLFRTARTPNVSRVRLLSQWVQGRTVLHVGFADHPEIIDAKRAQGRWLHDHLRRNAHRCVGIDIEPSAVAHVRRLGMDDVFLCGIEQLPEHPELGNVQWDMVILGEVVEHVSNPVHFLRSVRNSITDSPDAEVIVTVPNAWDVLTLAEAIRGRESINTDHRYFFTPYTIAKIMTDAGYDVKYVITANGYDPSKTFLGWAYARVTGTLGLLRSGLVAVAKARPTSVNSFTNA